MGDYSRTNSEGDCADLVGRTAAAARATANSRKTQENRRSTSAKDSLQLSVVVLSGWRFANFPAISYSLRGLSARAVVCNVATTALRCSKHLLTVTMEF